MFKRTLALLIACVTLLSPIFVIANEAAKEIALTQHISEKYLTSMFGAIKTNPTTTEKSKEPLGFFDELKKQFNPEIETLPLREAQQIAFDITSLNALFESTIVDSSFIDKLEIVGGGENTKEHLFAKIFDTHINTMMGKARTILTLCHPSTDIDLLHNRQKAITHLSNNYGAFDSILATIAQFEQKSLILWSTKPLVKPQLLAASYFNKIVNAGGFANTNTLALEVFGNKYPQLLIAATSLFGPYVGSAYAIKAINKKNLEQGISQTYWQTTKFCAGKIYNGFIKNPDISLNYKLFSPIVPLYCALVGYITVTALTSATDMHNHLQDILIATTSHINELKKLSSLLNKNKELLTYLPTLQPLANLNNPAKHSAQLNKLLGMLDTNTFKGEASFFSITGRVLAAYELMKQVKDEFAPVFAAAGELDMYVALAKLYNDHENKNARYCMVDFVENSQTPIIKAHNFWNPFINADTVVINDVSFDASCPNSILTGANTGGKSTVIKAIMLNVLMAQTFGIAPSRSLTMTPFAKLNCFMNISDDIATGASLFKSEVIRAKKLLDMVQGLQPNELSFVIIDEVFTGTSPKEGEEAALQFTKKLGAYKNNISIIATHYPKMTDLETETNGNYRNLHVEILRNEDGSLNRTFKLKHGPTFENVAFDILQEEGLFV
jgi:hypothetical protein